VLIVLLIAAPVTVTSVAPSVGPFAGSTTILLTGSNLIDSSLLSCRFGSVIRMAVWQSASTVQCVAPASNASGPVTLEVSNNNVDFSSSGLTYTYRMNATVVSVLPTHGPVGGGSNVTVFGTNFAYDVTPMCMFG